MKAIDIINFINEDKFSKYTAKQIYDELGHEDFVDYLSDTTLKIIKNIDEPLKNAKALIMGTSPSIIIGYTFSGPSKDYFEIKYVIRFESFYINLFYKGRKFSTGFEGDVPNFSDRLKKELIFCYNQAKK